MFEKIAYKISDLKPLVQKVYDSGISFLRSKHTGSHFRPGKNGGILIKKGPDAIGDFLHESGHISKNHKLYPYITGLKVHPKSLKQERETTMNALKFLKKVNSDKYKETAPYLLKRYRKYHMNKTSEFAPGLPNKDQVGLLPNFSSPRKWEFVIQDHRAEKAGRHFDFRLGPKGGKGFSWVIKSIPASGEKVLAIRQPDHAISYFDFQGKIKKGYGKGIVNTHSRSTVEIIDSTPNKITFYDYSKPQIQKMTLIKMGGKNWLLTNHTISKSIKEQLNISPLKYKDQSKTYKKKPGDVLIPKIDGASSIAILKPGKLPVVFGSKRVSKKTGESIEYTPKLPGFLSTRVPKSLGLTILRGEVYGVTPEGEELPNRVLSGILNSKVEKSRRLQKDLRSPLRLAGYDVVKYKGKDYTNKTIAEKLKAISSISKIFPLIQDPLDIQKKIQFKEGKIVWRGGIPIKVKLKKDFDVYVRNIFLEGKQRRAGGIEYSHTVKGPVVGKVGTGWTHKELQSMKENPKSYIGRVAKIYSQEKLPSGALRAPSFNTWHLDK